MAVTVLLPEHHPVDTARPVADLLQARLPAGGDLRQVRPPVVLLPVTVRPAVPRQVLLPATVLLAAPLRPVAPVVRLALLPVTVHPAVPRQVLLRATVRPALLRPAPLPVTVHPAVLRLVVVLRPEVMAHLAARLAAATAVLPVATVRPAARPVAAMVVLPVMAVLLAALRPAATARPVAVHPDGEAPVVSRRRPAGFRPRCPAAAPGRRWKRSASAGTR